MIDNWEPLAEHAVTIPRITESDLYPAPFRYHMPNLPPTIHAKLRLETTVRSSRKENGRKEGGITTIRSHLTTHRIYPIHISHIKVTGRKMENRSCTRVINAHPFHTYTRPVRHPSIRFFPSSLVSRR